MSLTDTLSDMESSSLLNLSHCDPLDHCTCLVAELPSFASASSSSSSPPLPHANIRDTTNLLFPIFEHFEQRPSFQTVKSRLPKGPQGRPFDWKSIALLLILAPLLHFKSTRHFLREVRRDTWLRDTFRLHTVPSPSCISTYKNSYLGRDGFEYILVEFLSALLSTPEELMHFGEVAVDGFPIIAWVNRGKTLQLKELPYERIKELFQHIDLSFIDDILPVHKRCKQHSGALIKVHLMEELMVYRSLSAVVRAIRKTKNSRKFLASTQNSFRPTKWYSI